MPYREPDPNDPHSLVGVEIPADDEAHLDRAYVIAEEFARLGFDEGRLLELFRNPFYRSAYQAFRILGEEKVQSIIQEALQVWGRVRFVDRQISPLVQLEGLGPEKRKR